jgi:hypothetical protein
MILYGMCGNVRMCMYAILRCVQVMYVCMLLRYVCLCAISIAGLCVVVSTYVRIYVLHAVWTMCAVMMMCAVKGVPVELAFIMYASYILH